MKDFHEVIARDGVVQGALESVDLSATRACWVHVQADEGALNVVAVFCGDGYEDATAYGTLTRLDDPEPLPGWWSDDGLVVANAVDRDLGVEELAKRFDAPVTWWGWDAPSGAVPR